MRRFPDYDMSTPLAGLEPVLLEHWALQGFTPHVVETGTYLGCGTTRTLVNCVARFGRRFDSFVTIEGMYHFAETASQNLSDTEVEVRWGLSVRLSEGLSFLASDPLLRDHSAWPDCHIDVEDDPAGTYAKELDGTLFGEYPEILRPESLLRSALSSVADHRPLVCLDSAGGIGWLEYQITREVMGTRPFLLLLDDVRHIKHCRSLQHAEQDPRCTIIHTSPDRHAWSLITIE